MQKKKIDPAVKPYRDPLGVRAGKYFRNFRSPFTLIMFLLLLFQSLTVIFALYWMFSTSLKSQINFGIDNIGLPNPFRFDNFAKAFTYLNVQIRSGSGYRNVYLAELLVNSLLFAGGHMVMVVMTHAIAGYVLAKFKKFRIVRVIQTVIVVLLAVPMVTSLAAALDWNKTLGVYDNFPMILYTCIGIFDAMTLIFIGAYSGVHNSYVEAAKIDGAGNYRILFTIAIPLIRTIITIQAILTFIGQWNNHMTPYLYLPSMPTMAIALWNFSQSNTNAISSEPMQMAAAVLVAIPCIILFLLVQNKMVGSLTMGGLKG